MEKKIKLLFYISKIKYIFIIIWDAIRKKYFVDATTVAIQTDMVT